MTIPVDPLIIGARQLGIDITQEQVAQFERYASLQVEWNNKFNLTRITEPEEIVTKHFLDSLTCLKALSFPKDAMVIDVGTGPGLPGIAIKIVRPDILLVLLDSVQKKLSFLDEVISDLHLQDVETLHSRAEDAGHHIKHRERYDVVLARALGPLTSLSELCIPLARVKGAVLAMKGPQLLDELDSAKRGIGNLGGRVDRVEELTIPGTDIARNIVVIKKLRPTLKKFPRAWAEIKSNPL